MREGQQPESERRREPGQRLPRGRLERELPQPLGPPQEQGLAAGALPGAPMVSSG